MAQRTQIILEDDIDGGPADETVRFSFRGDEYEIDLSNQNVAQLRDAMEPFMRNGRKVSGQRRSRSDRPTSTNSDKAAELRAMREWARANGHTVSDKGRVSQSIQDAYRAAR